MIFNIKLSLLYNFISNRPIHGAAGEGHDDALLTLMAWGATGNERDKDGSVNCDFTCLI